MRRRRRFLAPLHLRGFTPAPETVAPVAWTSEAICLLRPTLVSLFLYVRSFAGVRLLRPLLTSRSAFASPFQAQGEISPGKNAVLHRAAAAIYAA